MSQERTGTTVWNGTLTKGTGVVTGSTGALGELVVSWPSRSEAAAGKTSPEEMLATAHASCYAMQLSHLLEDAGHTPESITASSTVTLDLASAPPISALAVVVVVKAGGGLDAATLERIADEAKKTCPVSLALAGIPNVSVQSSLA